MDFTGQSKTLRGLDEDVGRKLAILKGHPRFQRLPEVGIAIITGQQGKTFEKIVASGWWLIGNIPAPAY